MTRQRRLLTEHLATSENLAEDFDTALKIAELKEMDDDHVETSDRQNMVDAFHRLNGTKPDPNKSLDEQFVELLY